MAGWHETDGLRYLTFDALDSPVNQHAIFSRRGGVSPEPWRSLNVGGSVGDDPERVVENRRRSFAALDLENASLYDVYQVHGSDVICTDAPHLDDRQRVQKKADAILTNQRGVTLFMRFADCAPVFLFDAKCQVIGLVHAGWQGAVAGTAAAAVEAMQARYGSHPGNIRAVIGPSIGAHHYPVGADVIEKVEQVFDGQAGKLLQPHYVNGHESGVQFDLWQANRLVLEQAGVDEIEISGICTACHLEDWFSHRGENGRTGRFGALIALR
jgi:YfiH family protein